MAAEAPSFSKFEEKKKQHSDKRKQTVRSIFKKSGMCTAYTMLNNNNNNNKQQQTNK